MKTFSSNDAWNAEMDALEANWNKKIGEANTEYGIMNNSKRPEAGRQTGTQVLVGDHHQDAANFYASLLRTAAES